MVAHRERKSNCMMRSLETRTSAEKLDLKRSARRGRSAVLLPRYPLDLSQRLQRLLGRSENDWRLNSKLQVRSARLIKSF